MRVWNETMIANIEIYEVMKRLVKKKHKSRQIKK